MVKYVISRTVAAKTEFASETGSSLLRRAFVADVRPHLQMREWVARDRLSNQREQPSLRCRSQRLILLFHFIQPELAKFDVMSGSAEPSADCKSKLDAYLSECS